MILNIIFSVVCKRSKIFSLAQVLLARCQDCHLSWEHNQNSLHEAPCQHHLRLETTTFSGDWWKGKLSLLWAPPTPQRILVVVSYRELSNLVNPYMHMYTFYALSNTSYKPSISIEVKVYMVYKYLPYISYFANKGQMGHLHITEHQPTYLVQKLH